MEPTTEESRLQRRIWDLRSSVAFIEGDPEILKRVEALEEDLRASRWANKTPEEKFNAKIQEALDGS